MGKVGEWDVTQGTPQRSRFFVIIVSVKNILDKASSAKTPWNLKYIIKVSIK